MNIALIIYVVVSLAALTVMSYFLYTCKRNKETFCGTCQGLGNKVCTNKSLLLKLYHEGKLTEFTDRSKYPQHWNGNESE